MTISFSSDITENSEISGDMGISITLNVAGNQQRLMLLN